MLLRGNINAPMELLITPQVLENNNNQMEHEEGWRIQWVNIEIDFLQLTINKLINKLRKFMIETKHF